MAVIHLNVVRKDPAMASAILISLLVVVPLALLFWDISHPRRKSVAVTADPPAGRSSQDGARPSAS